LNSIELALLYSIAFNSSNEWPCSMNPVLYSICEDLMSIFENGLSSFHTLSQVNYSAISYLKLLLITLKFSVYPDLAELCCLDL